MSYMHIDNLYKARDILLFRECFAMEKIHGTSAHVAWSPEKGLRLASGGADAVSFAALFDVTALTEHFAVAGVSAVVFGEAYGGKMQGMKDTYGRELRFIAFEVKIGDCWLAVPQAEAFVQALGLDFVAYRQIPATIEALDAERDADSVQAVRNGCGTGKPREGIVLRPLVELRKNNGERIIAKHKREVFRETKTPRAVHADALVVLDDAQAIANEWVTEQRLTHVLDLFPGASIADTRKIIDVMVEDVTREAADEIVMSKEAVRAISRAAAQLFKARLNASLHEV